MILLDVTGMTCDGCSAAVRNAIAAQDSQAVIVVDRVAGRVAADTSLSPAETIAAVEGAGYEAELAAG